jgi:hypothetical protein
MSESLIVVAWCVELHEAWKLASQSEVEARESEMRRTRTMRETRAIHGLGIDILLMKDYKVKMMFASDSRMQISSDADPCADHGADPFAWFSPFLL